MFFLFTFFPGGDVSYCPDNAETLPMDIDLIALTDIDSQDASPKSNEWAPDSQRTPGGSYQFEEAAEPSKPDDTTTREAAVSKKTQNW